MSFVIGTGGGEKKYFSEVYTDSFSQNVTLTTQIVPTITVSDRKIHPLAGYRDLNSLPGLQSKGLKQ